MLTRLYLDNYRCLLNFEVSFKRINLLMGPNGAGKSSIFDALSTLCRFVSEGSSVEEMFNSRNLARWHGGDSVKQRFELDLEGNGGHYGYRLTIEHRRDRDWIRVGEESLSFDGRLLFEFSAETGKAHLYRDDHSSGGEFLFDWSRSGIGGLQERPENTRLVWFRKRLTNIIVVRLNPARMGAESRDEARRPDPDLTNFASWYRRLSQERQGQVMELNTALRKVLPGFDYLRLQEAGEGKLLKARFKGRQGGQEYKLDELSDGQRTLIALYTLLYCMPEEGATLCIDEPENFVALPEIEPWLDELDERCVEGGLQALLISHHPRPINLLARDTGLWIDRDGFDAPTRVRHIGAENDSGGLSVARLAERGWLFDD